MFYKKLILLLCLAVLSVYVSSQTLAASGFNLTTSPLPIELTTTPGGTVDYDLRVQNSGTKAIKLKVSLLKFKAAGETGQPELLKREAGDDYFDWVTFSKTSFTAEPGVWNVIKMTIKTPPTAAFAYYYAVVFNEDNSTDQTVPAANTSTLTGATATLVLLNVKAPGEKRQLSVTSFTADKRLYEYLPTKFSIKVHNNGNVHVVPTGDIYISRNHKNNVATIKVNESFGNVLPDSNRIFTVEWKDGFPVFETKRDSDQIISDKKGSPIQQLKWDFSKANRLRFGHYYAHLTLIYDDGTKDIPIDAEVSFWVLPWKLLIILTVLLIFIIALVIIVPILIIRLRRLKKKLDQGQKNVEE